MHMVHKLTRTAFALAIGWLLAYGIGSAAADRCSLLNNTCASPGIKSPMTPTGAAYCRIAPSHYLVRHNASGDGARFALPDSNETESCCQQTACFPVGPTVYLGNPSPASPRVQQTGTACIVTCNHVNITLIKNQHTFYDQSAPIYLLTKTIIC